ncbi:MAG TPA: hypothetical protein VKB10_08845 [Gaiellaceae bacterium]|nr:hypothetical protein [Gaiellaceae bacterium]
MNASDQHILSVRIPRHPHEQLARNAERHERRLSGEVRLALREHVLQRSAPPVEPLERAAADILDPAALLDEGDEAA